MWDFFCTFAADLTYIQCTTVSAKAELKGNPVQIRDSPAAVNSCHRFCRAARLFSRKRRDIFIL